jgi:Carboxypeptidase regulatory-like domain
MQVTPGRLGSAGMAAWLLFLFLYAPCLRAQPAAKTGNLSGTVFDAWGNPVPLAKLTLIDHDGQRRSVIAGQTGRYFAANLPSGSYTLVVTSPAFDEHTSMAVVEQDETVEAPILLTIAPQEMDPPALYRSYLDLLRDNAEITPGQQGGDIEGFGPYRARGNLSFNSFGQRGQDNNFLVDGIDNNENFVRSSILVPPPEAIAEVSLAAGYIPAELGHETGASVSVETRSGSNQFHGSAFEDIENSALDSRNFFDGADKPGLVGNLFGASAGGAIRRNDWFWFADAEAQRVNQGLTIISTVPAAAEKSGDFGNIAIFNPLTLASTGNGFTRQQFLGNRIPGSLIPLASQNLIDLYPNPNLPGSADNYRFTPTGVNNKERFDLRTDKLLPRGKIFVRISEERQNLQSPGAFPLSGGGYAGSDLTQQADAAQTNTTAWGVAVGYTMALGPQLVNELRVGAASINVRSIADDQGINSSAVTGIPGLGFDGLPSISPTGFTSLGAAEPVPLALRETNAQVEDTVSWIKGRHAWKFGVQAIRRLTDGSATEFTDRGTFYFTPDYTGVPGTAEGDSIASLLLGYPTEARRDVQFQPYHLRSWELAGFAQDQIQLFKRLTLQVGVRYSLLPPLTEANDRMVNFNFVRSAPALDQFAGQDGVNGYAGLQYSKVAFAPRAGFALDLGGSTTLRGGFSQDYDTGSVLAQGILAWNPPFAASQDFINGTYEPGPNIAAGLPAPQPVSLLNAASLNSAHGSIYAIQPQKNTPYADDWSLFLQRRLRPRLALEAGVTSSMGVHLFATYDANQPSPSPSESPANYPYQPYTSRIEYLALGGGSTYYGGQIKLAGELAPGLRVLMSYVYSKEIDDSIAPFTNPESRPDGPQDLYDPRGNRSLSPFDIAQRAVLSAHYDLPFKSVSGGAGARSLASALFANWGVSALVTIQTGFPFTPELAVNSLNNGNYQLPNRVGNGALPSGQRSYLQWFNTTLDPTAPGDAFQVPAPLQYGDSGFDILRGPGLATTDVALSRSFPIHERLRLELRGEAHNLQNRTNLALPDRYLGVESSGVISHTITPARQVQFGARLAW